MLSCAGRSPAVILPTSASTLAVFHPMAPALSVVLDHLTACFFQWLNRQKRIAVRRDSRIKGARKYILSF
jgi:hypothetical protein